MKTDMNVKIGSYARLCMLNKILASEMQNLKQQKTSAFAPLILKRWIVQRFVPMLIGLISVHILDNLFSFCRYCLIQIKVRCISELHSVKGINNWDK